MTESLSLLDDLEMTLPQSEDAAVKNTLTVKTGKGRGVHEKQLDMHRAHYSIGMSLGR